MEATSLLQLLASSPIVASIQPGGGTPLADIDSQVKLAQACALGGCRLLRVEGAESIAAVRKATGLPVIGRIDRSYPDSAVRSTPTEREIGELIATGCEVIALDASSARRPNDERLGDLVSLVRGAGRMVMADCADIETARFADHSGFDLIGTGLAAYSGRTSLSDAPDWTLLRKIAEVVDTPVLAEGWFSQEWQAEAALRIGAKGVVVGSALSDPIYHAQRFHSASERRFCRVAAFDIGVHWLRFALFDEHWEIRESDQCSLTGQTNDWIDWMKTVAAAHSTDCIAVASPGTVNPRNGHMWEFSGGLSVRFAEDVLEYPTFSLNRGLAAAWAHGCHPSFAGRRVATLLVGKSLSSGFVKENSLQMGSMGQYPRIHELAPRGKEGFDALLDTVSVSPSPTSEQKARANQAIQEAIRILHAMLLPEVIVIGGPVGVADWVEVEPVFGKGWSQCRVEVSPFGGQAALYGAAALALFPPKALRSR